MFELHPQLSADTIALGSFDLCETLLMNDRQFPWVILVPRRDNAREIFELDQNDQLQLMRESNAVAAAMMHHFNGDKFNLGALGNMVPQLHVHHIVRKHDDAAWPKPVWGTIPSIAYDSQQLSQTISELHAVFGQLPVSFKSC